MLKMDNFQKGNLIYFNLIKIKLKLFYLKLPKYFYNLSSEFKHKINQKFKMPPNSKFSFKFSKIFSKSK